MAPTMINSAMIFAEPYEKSEANNNSRGSVTIRTVVNPIKVSFMFHFKKAQTSIYNPQKITKNSLNHDDKVVDAVEREYPANLPGPEYKMELVWRNIIIFLFLHIGAIYGYYTPKRSWATVIFSKSHV